LVYYFNPTLAAAVFLWRRDDGRTLLIRRARDPGKGRLAPPGGFIDAGESAEVAARREIREEVGVEIRRMSFLGSFPNTYPYGGVVYPVVDFFFTAEVVAPERVRALEDVAGFDWYDPRLLDPEALAFGSMQSALRVWQGRLRRREGLTRGRPPGVGG
jgi:ADP-ribose pyrophosphatase YjhB (NUDIX family)